MADDDKTPSTAGDLVREYMERKDLTLRQMSDLCGIHPTSLSLIAHNKASVGLARARKLAPILKIKADILCPPPVPPAKQKKVATA